MNGSRVHKNGPLILGDSVEVYEGNDEGFDGAGGIGNNSKRGRGGGQEERRLIFVVGVVFFLGGGERDGGGGGGGGGGGNRGRKKKKEEREREREREKERKKNKPFNILSNRDRRNTRGMETSKRGVGKRSILTHGVLEGLGEGVDEDIDGGVWGEFAFAWLGEFF